MKVGVFGSKFLPYVERLKPEIRNPKFETNSNDKNSKSKTDCLLCFELSEAKRFEPLIFDIRICFVFRYSDLEFGSSLSGSEKTK